MDSCPQQHLGNLDFYSWFFIEKIINIDHVICALYREKIFSLEDCQEINPTLEDGLKFNRMYTSLRRSSKDVADLQNDTCTIKLKETLIKDCGKRALRKSSIVYEKIRLKCEDSSNFGKLLEVLRTTQNGFISELLLINPQQVRIGHREWEKIVLDLWDDVVSCVDYNLIAPFLVEEKILSSEQDKYYQTHISNNIDRMANLLLLLSDRFCGLQWLEKSLISLESSHSSLAQTCRLMDENESALLNCHEHFFLNHIKRFNDLVGELYCRGILSIKDQTRILNDHSPPERQKQDLFRALRRKKPGVIEMIIDCCHRSGNDDVGIVLGFNPKTILHWEEVEKLKSDWDYLIKEVKYEHIFPYFLHCKLLTEKEQEEISNLIWKEDKMRKILAILPVKNNAYEAFFQALILRPEYDLLIQRCLTMDFDEARRLLEVQDFLWQHIDNTDQVVEKLGALRIIESEDAAYIVSLTNGFDKNLSLCNLLKQRAPGTVDKFAEVLWLTQNRNAAEILSVDFRNFLMSTEEWTKWKAFWITFVNTVRYKNVATNLIETGILKPSEHHWVLKSQKNRPRMRKLLRILPSKVDGYKSFLMALSTFKEYQDLLFKCQLMEYWDWKRLHTNYDFLIRNTKNLPLVLNELESQNTITEIDRRMINCYNDSTQVEELFVLLLGKQSDVIQKFIGSLLSAGNVDAAAVLNVDLSQILISLEEWTTLTNIWMSLVEEVNYNQIRDYLISSRFLDSDEDNCIMSCAANAEMIRMLLQMIPYKENGFRCFVYSLMPHEKYKTIVWNMIATAEIQKTDHK